MSTIFAGLSLAESDELSALGRKTLHEISEKEFIRYRKLLNKTINFVNPENDLSVFGVGSRKYMQKAARRTGE